MFNPKLKDFIEKDPGKTLIGFAWSLYWRLMVTVYGILMLIMGAFSLITAIID